MSRRAVIVAALAGVMAGSAWGQTTQALPDAQAVVGMIASAGSPPAKPSATITDRIETFRTGATTLPAAAAAEQWLNLMERAMFQPDGQGSGWPIQDGSKLKEVFEALPGPGTWDALVQEATRRSAKAGPFYAKRIGLRLLAHELAGDHGAAAADLRELQGVLSRNGQRDMAGWSQQRIAEAVLQQTDDPALVAAMFEDRLHTKSDFPMSGQIDVPDLVTLVGTEKATSLLRQALQMKDVQLEISGSKATASLARKLAVEMIDQLGAPQWGLVDTMGPDSVALYEALEKRFGAPTTKPAQRGWLSRLFSSHEESHTFDDYQKEQARGYYLAGLIAEGRTKDATVLVMQLGNKRQDLPYGAVEALSQSGRAPQVFAFFEELVTRQPQLPYWDTYIQLAGRMGKTAQALRNVREAAARPNLPSGVRAALDEQIISALLADDQVDEAVPMLQKRIAALFADAGSAAAQEGSNPASQLARLGLVLGRADLQKQGMDALVMACGDTKLRDALGGRRLVMSTAGFLHAAHRDEEAVKLLTEDLARPAEDQSFGNPVQEELASLLSIYHQAGRHADVLAMLQQIPLFDGDHLADVMRESDASMRPFAKSGQLFIGYMAASAEMAAGEKDIARRILHALLEREWGYDPGYALLVKLDGNQAISFFDEMYARDQFEERPLIWKAELLRRAHRLDEAEKTIRQAIRVDPSDGEEPRGDRMRAYAVLAAIRAEAGDAEQARFYEGAVAAIRMAEDADQLIAAGLLKRGIGLYQESLKHFADAYCIQSRLALQLAEVGATQAAEAHYQRAFELMPESFGEVESHCFGCEGAFRGDQAQSIAERVFMKLLASEPKKPQVHYLLGYLRYEQERYAEALPLFQQAVQLDPSYLNAWSKISELGRYVHLPAKDRDATTFAMMRLDPMSHHAQPDLQGVSDLKTLWTVKEELNRKFPAQAVDPLMELTASKAMRAAKKSERSHEVVFFSNYAFTTAATPAQAVAQQRVVNAVLDFLGEPLGG